MSIFESFTLEKKNIKNRILLSPFSDNQAEKTGKVSQHIFETLIRATKQGVGAIILDSAYICNQGQSWPYQLGISEEEHLPGLKNLVRILKEDGVFVGIRLAHAGARTNAKLCGEQPIGPSAIPLGKDYDLCREFDEHDTKEICTFFAHAAERAEEAGFDFIEINAAQSLLLDQCLNPKTNQREDRYGGSLKNRMQLPLEVIQTIRKRIKDSLLVSFFFNNPLEWYEEQEELKGQLELIEMVKMLEAAQVDLLHPVLVHVMNKISDSEISINDLIVKGSSLPLIIEGNIKSTSILKELLKSNRGTFYCLDKSIYSRNNWFQFLQKKIA